MIRRGPVELKGDAAEEDQEFNVFHLVGPDWIPNRVLNRHHALGVNCADVELGNFLRQADLSQECRALFLRDVLFLLMCEACVDFFDLRLVLFEDLIDFDGVAVVPSEVFTVH